MTRSFRSSARCDCSRRSPRLKIDAFPGFAAVGEELALALERGLKGLFGHGFAPYPGARPRRSGLAEEVVRCLAQLGPGSVALCGASRPDKQLREEWAGAFASKGQMLVGSGDAAPLGLTLDVAELAVEIERGGGLVDFAGLEDPASRVRVAAGTGGLTELRDPLVARLRSRRRDPHRRQHLVPHPPFARARRG